jgi:hypothetical protein
MEHRMNSMDDPLNRSFTPRSRQLKEIRVLQTHLVDSSPSGKILFVRRTISPRIRPNMRKIDLENFQVASSETARDINRRILLNLIRKHQSISRADLSRQSGLQRSTVSAIAEDLIAQRWVTEGAVGHLPRGRRPTFVCE